MKEPVSSSIELEMSKVSFDINLDLELHEDHQSEHRANNSPESPKLSTPSSTPPLEQFTIDEDPNNVSLHRDSSCILFKGQPIIIEDKNIFRNHKLKVQMVAAMMSLFLLGLSDQIIGSLIEHLLSYYHIDRVQVSFLFIAQFCGYIPASLLNNYLLSKYGFHKLYYTSCLVVMVSSTLFLLKAPFYILPFGSVMFGWANGTFDCCLNYFVGTLDYSNELLGIAHAMYGVGCLVTPILSIHLIRVGMPWNHYYFVLIGTAFLNLLLAFFFFREETSMKYQYITLKAQETSGEDTYFDSAETAANTIDKTQPSIIETLFNKYVAFYCTALFLYVGSELSVGVWLNNYLFRIQHLTEEQASYITSLFWLFMTSGRVIMGIYTGRHFEDKEVRAMVIYCSLVALGCFSFWIFSSSVAAQTVSIAFAGWFVGPVFSTTIIASIKTLPKRYSVHGISLIAGLGGTGAAIIPGIMGWVSEHLGSPENDTDGNDGAGLYYFPELVCVTFTMAALCWLSFYLYNKSALDRKLRLQ